MKKRILIGVLVVVAVLLGGVTYMYAFGTPQAPSPAASTEADRVAVADQPGAASTTATGEAPAPDPSSPLAVEIPGCVCHSDDPKLVEEHASYRMNQCFGCHSGGVPEMGQ